MAMTEPDGIQREPSAPVPKPSGITTEPSTPERAAGVELGKCPHCDSPLIAEDVRRGRCWSCDRRLDDPVQPKQPPEPFLAISLLGLFGSALGLAYGRVLLGEPIGRASWTLSLCAGIGFAAGSALARSLFGKHKGER
jgi:hypothetical protein